MEWIESIKFFDIKLIDVQDLLNLVFRLLLDLTVTYIIVRKIYYPARKDKEYLFTFFIFNILVFFVCNLLGEMKLELGFAFGIFALFSILRYRTITLPVMEMTYLFCIIALAVIHAISNKKVSYAELLFTDLFIIGIIYYLQRIWIRKKLSVQVILYEKIENIVPENKHILLNDLKKRTGLDIRQVEISKINFLNDTARIKIYYQADEHNLISQTLHDGFE
ncbi:MAG: DUF4956 domain-containing protein [Chitinophagales bacterium]|nr:DUF4956 domain-containing protein [Bacteroidota bacterium]MCB9043516.1 DUF4956 domain-containing protein [Chitinophagales bacterium]